MFENLSTTSKVLMGVTAVGLVATVISAIKDKREADECCEECCCECIEDLADPTASL